MRLAQALAHILAENGYQTDVVHDGASGLAYAECGDYDVIILDVMLPKMDGFAVVAQLRRKSISVPVLLLTARDAVPDKITGLDSGADDYMTKPFAPAELLAHLRALTRRQGEVLFEKLAAGDLVLNLESYDLACGSKSIHLSYKEFSLAKVLMANAGQVVSKDMLIAKVWGVESSAEDNNVEASVSFLRQKMKFLGSTARIETLRRAGRGRAGRSARRLRQPGRPRAVLREAHRGRRRVPRVRGHERRKRLADPGRHTGGRGRGGVGCVLRDQHVLLAVGAGASGSRMAPAAPVRSRRFARFEDAPHRDPREHVHPA